MRSGAMSDAKRRNGQRLALGLAGLAAVWLVGVWPPPLWWRSHWPRCTAMMRLRGTAVSYQPSALNRISPLLQRMVIIGEDSRFRMHHGIDVAEIADAVDPGGGDGLNPGGGAWRTARIVWQRRDRIRGASTITQQLAKNLYLSPSRSALRKLKEAVTAVRLELALPKDRILALYLSLVERGPGIWGAEVASRQYFGVPAWQLDETQAAALAATLPHPRTSNPVFSPARMLARRDLILARYHGVPVYIPPEEELDSLFAIPAITPPVIPPLPDTLPDSLGMDTGAVKRGRIRRDSM